MKGPTTGALVVGANVGSAEGGLVSPTLVGLGVGLNVGSAIGAAAPSLKVTVVTRLTAELLECPLATRASMLIEPAPADGKVKAPPPREERQRRKKEGQVR